MSSSDAKLVTAFFAFLLIISLLAGIITLSGCVETAQPPVPEDEPATEALAEDNGGGDLVADADSDADENQGGSVTGDVTGGVAGDAAGSGEDDPASSGSEAGSGSGGGGGGLSGMMSAVSEAASQNSSNETTTQNDSPFPSDLPSATPQPTATSQPANQRTPQPQSQPQTQPATHLQPVAIPEVSLHLTRDEYPRVDGSTATIPLSVMLAQAVTGMNQTEAEAFISHTKTSQAFYNLAFEYTDILIVYAPQDSLFDELEEYYEISKSSFVMEPIGRDALVFLVNDQNPVKSLTHDQLLAVYTGAVTEWSALGAARGGGVSDEIVAFQRNKSSGSQVMMENLVMDGIEMADAPTRLVVAEMEGLVASVAEYNNSGNAIGYSVYYYFTNMFNLEGVRALDVNGIPCANETIRDGSYPFVQDFYAVIRRSEPASSSARKLFNLLTGREGQALIEAAGYVAIRGGAGGVETGTPGSTGAVDAGSRPVDTLATIKRKPADSVLGSLFGGSSQKQNIFPIAFGDKTGFVNGSGELVVEPLYDAVYSLMIYEKDRILYNNYGSAAHLYYYARIFKRDTNGVPDMESLDYAAVIGPSGEILYETRDPYTSINSINIADNSLIGYRSAGDALSNAGPGAGMVQFIVFADGKEVTLAPNEYFLPDTGGSNRWIHNYNDTPNAYYLIDGDGKRISGRMYDVFVTYNDDAFIFSVDDRIVAINNAGEEIYTFPGDIRSLSWDANSNLFIYMSAELTEVSGEMQNCFGLMDRNYTKMTAAIWPDISPTEGGKVFRADARLIPGPLGSGRGMGRSRSMILIDENGNQLTEKVYNYIFSTNPGYIRDGGTATGAGAGAATGAGAGAATGAGAGAATGAGADINTGNGRHVQEYFLGEYDTEIDGNIQSIMDLIDANGNVLLTYTEGLQINWVYGDYAVLYLTEKASSDMAGLKRISNNSNLASLEEGWLIPPIYGSYTDAGGAWIIAGIKPYLGVSGTTPIGESTVVFDAVRGEVAFKGEYQAIQFAGYAVAGGDAGIFYAETSTRKGYLNSRGEWIVSLSKFDTLDIDG